MFDEKGETKMNYHKPEVLIVGSAVEAILGGGKPLANVTDGPPHTGTIGAYEADE